MIRTCDSGDFEAIYAIINDAAQAYKGVIPDDRWKEPYMNQDELQHEIDDGVVFWGFEEGGELLGVMGLQHVEHVTLIRHAYVRTSRRNQGIGGRLLTHVRRNADRPMLVGTWAAAVWAVRFYERHGFRLVSPEEKDRLLREYWSIPERQVETSVVLADPTWLSAASC
jgi:GNAT superfamily N-acetyltransferase